ncbi:EKA-like protein [Blumeria hordei DH14]|uniref:EKA-like protein n=1 Tax=Blumeria graminis f. sp. hordei (strain DH14) TaxID=546991 RepID=N1JAJ9_BLUG1|nr:EKA-like protein [Blumeria hordei DH14]
MTEYTEMSARKFAVPASKSTASTSAPEFPPVLQSVMEAEKRRMTQIKARLAICSTAISSVEAELSPLSIGEEKEFLDGIKVYLRAAIGQFVQSGPEAHHQFSMPSQATIFRRGLQKTQAPAQKTIRAKVARAGLCHSTGPSTKKAAPPAPKTKGTNTRIAADTRLFLRLAHNHPHRLLLPAGVRSAVEEVFGTAAKDITLGQRVKIGFELTAKNELARKELLDSSTSRRESGIKLEPA